MVSSTTEAQMEKMVMAMFARFKEEMVAATSVGTASTGGPKDGAKVDKLETAEEAAASPAKESEKDGEEEQPKKP